MCAVLLNLLKNDRIPNIFEHSTEDTILQAQRIERILALLSAHGFRTNQALATDLDVSEMTIRRDLTELSEKGLVKRVRGGVRMLRRMDPHGAGSLELHSDVDHAIAEAAADLVVDGETIYLDNGPATLALARSLRQREMPKLRIVTNSVALAALLCSDSANLIQLGGEVRGTGAVVGQQPIRFIESMHFDRCFICADGFSFDFGVSGKHLPEIEVKRAAMQNSSWTALLSDSSRWGKQSMLRIANLRDLQCLITDEGLDPPSRDAISERGVTVVMADG